MSAPHGSKPLGLAVATALVVGNMVGSGVLLLPAALAPFGRGAFVGWAVSLVGAVALAIAFAELSRRRADSGGPYALARAAFGARTGFVTGWSYWIAIWTGNAAIGVTCAGALGLLWPPLTATPLATAATSIAVVFTAVALNLLDLRTVGRVAGLITAAKLLPFVGLVVLLVVRPNEASVAVAPPSTVDGVWALALTTTPLTLWAFLGFESATVPAGEVENAERNVPIATYAGLAIAALITIAACQAVVERVPPEALQKSGAPFADLISPVFGPTAAAIVAAATALAAFGTLNGWTLLSGQFLKTIADDGQLPAAFARVDARGVPRLALLVSAVLAAVLVYCASSGSLGALFQASILLSTAATLLPYLIVASGAVVLWWRARATSHALPPVMLPAGIIGALFSVWALVGSGSTVLMITAGLVVVGVPLQWLAAAKWR